MHTLGRESENTLHPMEQGSSAGDRLAPHPLIPSWKRPSERRATHVINHLPRAPREGMLSFRECSRGGSCLKGLIRDHDVDPESA